MFATANRCLDCVENGKERNFRKILIAVENTKGGIPFAPLTFRSDPPLHNMEDSESSVQRPFGGGGNLHTHRTDHSDNPLLSSALL